MTSLRQTLRSLAPGFLVDGYGRWREHQALSPLARQILKYDQGAGLGPDRGPEQAIAAMCTWLSEAQDGSASADGGFSRHFDPSRGWAASYPETTGYIIPTLIDEAEAQSRPNLRERARRALHWLCAIQFPEGGFQGGIIGETPRVPVTFNTGQILLGLAAGIPAFGESACGEAARRAAHWLVNAQDADGCWRHHGSPFTHPGEKAYETHVAWGLLEADRVLPGNGFGAAALRQIRWALTKQEPNGWFRDCCLMQSDQPLTHTIGYALRGVIEGYRYASDPALLEAALKTATALLGCLNEDGRMAGRLDHQWRPTVDYVCLTGTSQIAFCWMQLFEFTGERRFLDAARRANRFVRRTLVSVGHAGVDGGVKGSHPIDGGYGKFQYLNWAAKFTIDANRRELLLAGA